MWRRLPAISAHSSPTGRTTRRYDGIHLCTVLRISLLTLCCSAAGIAQESGAPNRSAATFESKVNLVLVPVVVRDAKGRTVGGLTKDDFQIFDKGKLQSISIFTSVDHSVPPMPDANGSTAPTNPAAAKAPSGRDVEVKTAAGGAPTPRSIIYLFDDLNIHFAMMANLRDAAIRHFDKNLGAGDRAAVYAFSGKPSLEFTSVHNLLRDAVLKLRWRPRTGQGMECPDVSYYIADLVIAKNDGQALAALTAHTAECAHVRPELARGLAVAAAERQLVFGSANTQVALGTIRRAIRRLSTMPGQRLIVLASPGFFAQTPEAIRATAGILDLAAKSNVVISSLSARGVIVADEEADVAARGISPRRSRPGISLASAWIEYQRESARADGDVMKDLAEGTGGSFYRNNNDLLRGMDRIAAAPEFSYVLGFSPSELKSDGRFHALKVRLTEIRNATVEARRGYYAIAREASRVRDDIDEAVFSRDQINDIPVVLQTGYSKPMNSDEAKVLVTGKIDVAGLPFKQTTGRNVDSLHVAGALFDSEGAYIGGAAQLVNLKLFDATLKQKDPSVTLHFEFPGVKPGAYVIRLVVVESEGRTRTTLNRSVTVR